MQQFKADIFKALAHPTRIRILELTRGGELSVTELQEQLSAEPSTVSQQLAVLRSRQLVVGRKEGTSVFYSAADPLVYDLLDTARGLFEKHVGSLQALVDSATAAEETQQP